MYLALFQELWVKLIRYGFLCNLVHRYTENTLGILFKANTSNLTWVFVGLQDLESVLPPEYLTKTIPLREFTGQLQEWSSMHDSNQQLHQDATGFSSPASRVAAAGFVSLDTSESSPGMSSTGNEDLGYSETKGWLNSLCFSQLVSLTFFLENNKKRL